MNSPFVLVIFGATGDLAQHKLIPALFSLFKQKQLGSEFYIVGFARREFSNEDYAHMLGDELETHKDPDWAEFSKNIFYQQGLFDEEKGYKELIDTLAGFDKKIGACITRLFYLATPPDNYLSILNNLKESKLSEGCGQGSEKFTRLAIEKPFGRNLETAQELDMKLADIFEEHQIYRVDHYLGKETVQNMIAFRFANNIFEPVWNKNYIDHVQITMAEIEGVRTRGKFFDGVGILRDIVQNHLLQLLATVAMEQPASFSKEGVRDARANAIKAIRPIEPADVSKYVVRGQYEGYRDEKDVKKDSNTDTFAAMKLFVDTPRFENVPFYIRTGKKMPKEVMEISIIFIQTCHLLFKEYGCPEIGNVLTIRVQPDEGIGMRVITKQPGSKVALGSVDMKFTYKESFGEKIVDAYEKLLLDIFHADQMLFNRSDELESSWRLISNVLTGWDSAGKNSEIPIYEPGSWGPKEANELIEKDGKKWLK
ncbi:MAG TPA: glucose-6-phosphate dehydrogenase [Candidatus Limnocylindrales bacterium]|nr:glucose-6-phosphate dehydrogenase [Candidatus Limnocylindrales bacterium]